MHILALVPGGISEQLLFFPTLEHLKRTFPNAEISVVVEPSAAAAYRVSKVVQATIPYTFQKNNSPADWANLLGIMRDREYDVVITATTDWATALLLWLSGVPNRIGYQSGANTLFLTTTVPLKTEQYVAFQYHDLIIPLEVVGPCPDPTINVPQGDIDWVNNQIQSQGIDEQGYVLIYPGLAEGAKDDRYPVENWISITQDFQKRQPGLPLVLLQQPETADTVKLITQSAPNLTVIRPDNLGQTAALVAGANLVLATDSYVSELGVALSVFTLVLFGQNSPERRLPPVDTSEQRFLGVESGGKDLADIPVETVLKKVWGEG
ncbi:glycosyltransferase family 9 protein [Oscillatoria sp. CS-180]|uniref:glycosyltransferase family 9 protein n=1 Tax=Oscillatoria sp. CS-180 TaxID=3021720 RepID=UPI00232CD9C1|nr:glycosyltransferase family 9 protein [Oscillatoria sp. CS-180]MDB9528279.1 glycosyltransferase family 9 protein [Oscillatoria sp. CS-180]